MAPRGIRSDFKMALPRKGKAEYSALRASGAFELRFFSMRKQTGFGWTRRLAECASGLLLAIAVSIAPGCSASMKAQDVATTGASPAQPRPVTVEVYEDPKAAVFFYFRIMLNPAFAQMTSQVVARYFRVIGTTDDKLGDGNADLVAVPSFKDPDGKWLHYELTVEFVDCRTEQTVSTLSVSRTFQSSKAWHAEPVSLLVAMIPPALPIVNVHEATLAAADIGDYTSLLMGDLDVALAKDQKLLAYQPPAKTKTAAAAKSQTKVKP